MGRVVPSICGTTCVAWIVVWSWFLSKESANTAVENVPPSTSFRVVDADSIFSTNKVFSFGLSEAKVDMPAESAEMLRNITRYLVEFPEKKLTLTGEYLSLPYERNQTPHPNLGIARANSIKNILVANGADEESIQADAILVKDQYLEGERLLGGIVFSFNTSGPQPIAEKDVPEEKEEEPVVEEKEKDSEVAPEQIFKYKKKFYSLDRRNKPVLDKIRRLLKNNSSYKVMITGISTKGEEASVKDLANRRAKAVRRYLVDTG